jgi:hypothetical protein
MHAESDARAVGCHSAIGCQQAEHIRLDRCIQASVYPGY